MMISVCVITYNQDLYIREAIESILSQNTVFDYEVVISNDCSTDLTDVVIGDLIKNHPEGSRIRYFSQSKNLGAMGNLLFAIEKCSGKYLAICEADDFWTDNKKLEKQLTFLEANLSYGLVHHDANYYFQNNNELIKDHHKKNNIYVSNGDVYKELLINNNIYTPTVVFRADLFKHFLSINEIQRDKFLMADYVMWLAFSLKTKFYYMPESMATYRVLSNSASKSRSYEKSLAFVYSYFDIKLFFLAKYPLKDITTEIVEKWRLSICISTAIKYRKNKEARAFGQQLDIYDWRSLLKKGLIYLPLIFRYIQRKNKH